MEKLRFIILLALSIMLEFIINISCTAVYLTALFIYVIQYIVSISAFLKIAKLPVVHNQVVHDYMDKQLDKVRFSIVISVLTNVVLLAIAPVASIAFGSIYLVYTIVNRLALNKLEIDLENEIKKSSNAEIK